MCNETIKATKRMPLTFKKCWNKTIYCCYYYFPKSSAWYGMFWDLLYLFLTLNRFSAFCPEKQKVVFWEIKFCGNLCQLDEHNGTKSYFQRTSGRNKKCRRNKFTCVIKWQKTLTLEFPLLQLIRVFKFWAHLCKFSTYFAKKLDQPTPK